MRPSTLKRITTVFEVQPVRPMRDTGDSALDNLREHTHALALLYARECPDGRELNASLKCLEESLMWCVNGIFRGGGDDPNEPMTEV